MHSIYKLIFVVVALLSAQIATARDVMIRTIPSGALMELTNLGSTRIKGAPFFKSPAEIAFRRRSLPYTVEISLPNYETVKVSYDYHNTQDKDLTIELKKLVETKEFIFKSEPAGAEVYVDGNHMGQTPLIAEVRFTRSSSESPGRKARLRSRYQTTPHSASRSHVTRQVACRRQSSLDT